MRPKELEKGFTLIELIATIILLATLSYVVALNLNQFEHNRIEVKRNIITAIEQARVLSITRDIEEGEVKVLIDSESVSLLLKGRSYQPKYPLTFSQPIGLKEGGVELIFNNFGETQKTKLTMSIGKHIEVIQVENTGYAF